MPTVALNHFVQRQTWESPFSCFDPQLMGWENVVKLAQEHLAEGHQGYRDGVLLVPVPPQYFYCGIVQLKDGDVLVGQYKARQPGEEPRKSVHVVGGKKVPALSVTLVLYRHDVLVETNEADTDADWELISVNASSTEDELPIPVGALIANHLQLSGGTATNMTDAEFVAALRKSVLFWRDKANIADMDTIRTAHVATGDVIRFQVAKNSDWLAEQMGDK